MDDLGNLSKPWTARVAWILHHKRPMCSRRHFPVLLGGNHACQQTWELLKSQILTSIYGRTRACHSTYLGIVKHKKALGVEHVGARALINQSSPWKQDKVGHRPMGHMSAGFCCHLLKGQRVNIFHGLGPPASCFGPQTWNPDGYSDHWAPHGSAIPVRPFCLMRIRHGCRREPKRSGGRGLPPAAKVRLPTSSLVKRWGVASHEL